MVASRSEFWSLERDEIALLHLAAREKSEEDAKAQQQRDAVLYSVIASCTTGRAWSPDDFIHDPEREAKKAKAEADYEKVVTESRKAHEARKAENAQGSTSL